MAIQKAEADDLSGIWICRHWYPSNNHEGDDMSECLVQGEQIGNKLVLQSIADEHGAYLLVRLRIDGDFAHGSWSENASTDGEFEGKLYSGLMEMIIDEDKRRLAGKWVGIGQDRVLERPDVYVGRWELQRPS